MQKDNRVEKGVKLILDYFKDHYDIDPKDENFIGTPHRIQKAYNQIFFGAKNTDEQVKKILSSAFPSDYNGLVLVKEIRVFSMCPHHLLPVDYKMSIAYITSPDGKVLGISKIPRLAKILAARPVLQEQLGEDIVRWLMQIDGCQGAGCVIHGIHYCMVMRGANQVDGETITSSLKGVFLEHSQAGIAARNELMLLSKNNK